MKKRFTSLMLTILLILQCLPAVGAADTASISCGEYILTAQLESVVTEVLYGGDTEEVTYIHTPSAGMQYLLVYLTATVASGSQIDLDDIAVVSDGKEYDRIIDDSFIGSHSYSALRHGTATITSSGWVAYEIPQDVSALDLVEDYSLNGGDGTTVGFTMGQVTGDPYLIEQTPYNGYAERQAELEASYLATAMAGDFTAENPYIIVNPYEIAPQTALIIFKTENPVSITSTIHGKGSGKEYELTTITNTIEDKTAWHEIPLIGLYAGENTVTLELSDGNIFTYQIITQDIPADKDGVASIDVITSDYAKLSEGLYFLHDQAKTLVDAMGEIRGYFNVFFSADGADEVSSDGHIFATMNEHTVYSTIYELDFLGRIYNEIDIPNIGTDHDAYLLDNNLLLLREGTLNLETYEHEYYSRAWNEIFNDTQGSFEVRRLGSADWNDWLHFNTVTDGGDGYILVSMRGQHAVAKLSYPELEVQWVLSVNNETLIQEEDYDKYLTPEGEDFEWFYSQHDVYMLSDNGDGTMDILLFDNGIQRGLDPEIDYPVEEMYSRMVHYRVNENTMTVEQIWDYGEEYGVSALSYVNGSTRYISESDSYLGNFNTYSMEYTDPAILDTYKKIMTVLEVTSEQEVILEWHMDNFSYRVEKISNDWIYSTWQGLGSSESEYVYIGNNLETLNYSTEETPAIYQIHNISATQNYLEISGWVAIEGALDTVLWNRRLILTNKDTGEFYHYVLSNDAAQTKVSTVPSELAGTIDSSAGFYHTLLNLTDLDDGDYSVILLASFEGRQYAAETEYTLRIGSTEEETIATPVASTDILASQSAVDTQLQAVYDAGSYSMSNPLVVVDPYDLSPLTAIAMFETDKAASISITVKSKDGAADVINTFNDMTTDHIIPIYGLYSGEATDVILTATYANGTTSTSTISVTGNAIPSNLITGEVTVSTDTSLMAPGWTFISLANSDSYAHAVDETGAVRWVYSVYGGMSVCSPINLLENGHLLANLSEGTGGNPRHGVQEFDLTGKVYAQYMWDGVHHDMIEMPNGNLVVLVSDIDGSVKNETIVEIDRETGETVRLWDLDAYFAVPVNANGKRVSDENYGSASNWFHNNSIVYDEEDTAFLLSSRVQDAVIKIDIETGDLIWIMSNPDSNWTEEQESKLLTPTGDLDAFEWQYGQHNIVMLPDGDLLIFDNGDYRGKTAEDVIPAEEGYSRVVRYRIDEENMTVEQVWEYGAERGTELMAAYVGGQTYLGEEHYLMHFGGIVKNADGEAVYDFSNHLTTGFTSTHIIEILDDEVIFEYVMDVEGQGGNTYRSVRREAYTSTSEMTLTEGVRYGSLIYRGVATETTLSTTAAISPEKAVTATDNGIYLEVQNLTSGADKTLYFVGDTIYETPVSISNNAFQMIGGEVPVGSYQLYYSVDGTLYDLDLVWENTTTSKDIPVRLNITVASSDEAMGSAYGEGTYFANTALTVTAMPQDGYVFQGWKQNGTIVSRDENYSFIPTCDAALTAVFIPEGTWNSQFVDVIYGDWFYDYVAQAVEAGLFIGTSDTTFSPNMEMTVEMVSIVLSRMSNDAIASDVNPLADYGFELSDAVSREALAMMLYTYAQSVGMDMSVSTSTLSYTDADSISSWAQTAMAWCVENGILTGKTSTTLDPADTTTRAEVSTVMMRLEALTK